MSEKIKVIQLIHGLSMGGAETLVKDYVTQMPNSVENVVVILETPGEYANERIVREAGIRIISIAQRIHWKDSNSFFVRVYRKFARKHRICREIKKIIQEERPDCIHVHLPLLRYLEPIASTLRGIRLFYTCHSTPERLFSNAFRGEFRAAKKLLSKADLQMIALHEDMAKQLNAMFEIDNSAVVGNGIDLDKFAGPGVTQREMREELGIPADRYVVGHVGRFHDIKNHVFLVDVFEKIYEKRENAFLLMVGSGDTRKEIEKRLNGKNLGGQYMILENRSDIPRVLQAMDVFVFPSKFEGFGTSVIEAQAAGLRCVISDAVPSCTMVTDHIFSISLAEKTECWSQLVLSDSKGNEKLTGKLQEYDMRNTVQRLKELYGGKNG